MENKKYLDKVIEHLVRNTNMDYEKEIMTFPFPSSPLFSILTSSFFSLSSFPTYSFKIYCKNTFGLTEEEIDYVYLRYVEIIFNKIKNGQ